jgi:hypothetical protein
MESLAGQFPLQQLFGRLFHIFSLVDDSLQKGSEIIKL